MQLVVTLEPAEPSQQAGPTASPEMPASLILGRTARFRQAVKVMAATLDLDADDFAAQVVATLAALAHAMGRISPRRTGGAFLTHSC